MRAARYERTGSASEVLRVGDVERPDPGPGEVRVRLAASGINPTDWKVRNGTTGTAPNDWQVPHHDGAGEIDAVGEGVDPGRIGQRVWVWFAAFGRRWGTAAQWTVIPATRAVDLPPNASFDLGASVGIPAMTAYRCLFADGSIEGADVLVAGGAGAVGHFAIELAKLAGARVATTVSGPAKADLALQAGADAVIDYHADDAIDQLRRFAPTFDRVVEVALGANLELDLAVAGPSTVIVTYASEAVDPTLPVRRCMTANLALRFVLIYGVPPGDLHTAAAAITDAMRAGALTELPVRRFPLEEIAAAQDAVQAGHVGKVLVELP
jgi:NADPH2:quinone reductase